MHKKIYSTVLLLPLWIFGVAVHAQDTAASKKVQMADKFRAEGKIYVVIAVLVTILLGLVLYVMRLDRKIDKLEKEQ